jgi:hypothetical protein
VAAQDGVGNAQHQHAIRAAEGDFVMPSAVAQREVAGTEAGLAAVLAIDAFAFHLQVQEEQRAARTSHVRARMAHQLRVRIHLGQGQVANAGARDAAVESTYVYGI